MSREAATRKADRLLLSRCVSVLEVRPEHALAEVRGDHDRYLVTHDGRRWGCDCPTPPGRPCSHGIAAAAVIRREAR